MKREEGKSLVLPPGFPRKKRLMLLDLCLHRAHESLVPKHLGTR